MSITSRFLFLSLVMLMITRTAFLAGGLPGGYQKQPLSVCRTVLKQANLGENNYLKNYLLVSCKTQVVEGMNYQVELKPFREAKDSVLLEVFQPFVGELVPKVTRELPHIAEEAGLMGNYHIAPLKDCELILEKANFDSSYSWKDYVVSKCHIQIVSGRNYKMTLLNRDRDSLSKEIIIYKDLNDKLQLKTVADVIPLNPYERINRAFAKTDLLICMNALKNAVEQNSEYLTDYEIIECSTQRYSGVNYKMLLKLNASYDMSRRIVINQTQKKYKITHDQVIEDNKPGKLLVGGYTEQKSIENCFEAIRKVGKDSFLHMNDFRLISCETQVVNGIKYRLTLKTSNQSTCYFVINRSSGENPQYIPTDSNAEND